MAQPLVLFVPGYPEPGSAATLAHRFAHALAIGGNGAGVVLAPGEYDAISTTPGVDPKRIPGLSTAELPALFGDEQLFFAEAHESTLESNGLSLKAPASATLIDPFVAQLADPEIAAIRVFYSYLWEYSTKKEVRYAAQKALQAAISQHARRALLVVAHGLGAVVAYDALFKLGPSAPPVDLLTLGAPLGLRVVQRRVKAKARADAHFPIPDRVRSWTNIAGHGDLMAADPTLGEEFNWGDDRKVVDLATAVDTGWPFHRWEGYARAAEVRETIRTFLTRQH